jgi:hypothetical protein
MLVSQTVNQTADIQPSSHSDSNVSGVAVTNYIGLASILFILIASIYTLKNINQASESNRKKEIKSLLSKLERQKRDSINRYERDIDRLIERVREIAQSSQKSAESKFLEELAVVDLAGFGKESKINNFNKVKVEPIINSELSNFQERLRKLGEEFYSVEDRLDKDFKDDFSDTSARGRP